MATTTYSERDLVDTQPILYIRENNILCQITDARPNARLYVYFDKENVTGLCTPSPQFIDGLQSTEKAIYAGSTFDIGDAIYTDNNGRAAFNFWIEGGKYITGDKEILVTDVDDLALLDIVGNVYGSAKATFGTKGVTEVYQTTTTTIIEVPPPVVFRAGDPLAQSFFTYDTKTGIFVTAIEIFFQSKDESLPIILELREMVNGYPSQFVNTLSDTVVSLTPDKVAISNDASLGTVFRFPVPIHLSEDKDYCFILMSNSGKYNAWTARMGERAIETGSMIYRQPFVGSVFKSENNITWSAEQFEDLKFNMYRAEFRTNTSGELTLVGNQPSRSYYGTRFNTTAGSNKVVFRGFTQHGLSAGSDIAISVDTAGTYNGITGANFNGTKVVSKIIDEYALEFEVGQNATSTGPILSSGVVQAIAIQNSGSGYTSTPTVLISAPASGTQATATAKISNGKIVEINITNKGSGYVSNPTVSISGGGGVGASAIAMADAMVGVSANKKVHSLSPQIKHSSILGTSIDTTYRLATPGYGLSIESPMSLETIEFVKDERIIASRFNEFSKMANQRSFQINMGLISSNPTVSPTIDLREGLNVFAYTNAINNHSAIDTVSSTLSSSGVIGYASLAGGSGYVDGTGNTVTVLPAENDPNIVNIVPAVITSTASGGAITSLTITSPGSGYTKVPTIVISPPSSGTTATAQAILNPINSEINTLGAAHARYVTKKIQLKNTSTAIKLNSYIYSTPETNVDWYIRTSLAGDQTEHEQNEWKLLKCEIERNKSTASVPYYDYEFTLTDIDPFDVYDLKCVMSSQNQSVVPYIKNYRVVVAA